MTVGIEGTYDPSFQKLIDLFKEKFSAGEEVGAAININKNGVDIVDVWAGYTDEARTTRWSADTIVNVYSSTKTVAAIAVLLAHERGKLNLDDPVAKHWPEFAANGKEKTLIRHVMSHDAGLSGWELPTTLEEVCNVPVSTARLEKQAPWWEAGTGSGYHATSQGHLLGEIVRRATGTPMKQFVARELAQPLHADFQIGAKEEDWPRIATLIPPPLTWDVSTLDQNGLMYKSLFNPRTSADFSRNPLWRNADMCAVNGHGTAKGLNKILRVVTLSGTVNDKVKLLSAETVGQIFRTQSETTDRILGIPLRFGIGFAISGGLSAQTFDYLPQERMCFWSGWGGSFAICDLHRGVTFTYVMNRMGAGIIGNERSIEYARMAWQILRKDEK